MIANPLKLDGTVCQARLLAHTRLSGANALTMPATTAAPQVLALGRKNVSVTGSVDAYLKLVSPLLSSVC